MYIRCIVYESLIPPCVEELYECVCLILFKVVPCAVYLKSSPTINHENRELKSRLHFDLSFIRFLKIWKWNPCFVSYNQKKEHKTQYFVNLKSCSIKYYRSSLIMFNKTGCSSTTEIFYTTTEYLMSFYSLKCWIKNSHTNNVMSRINMLYNKMKCSCCS